MSILKYFYLLLMRYVRLAPTYYIIFLIGWQIGPTLGEGPCWFTYEKGFSTCNEYWWSVFTMTINFVPKYVIANEGCFFWGWYPACEIQIFIVLPIIVYLIFKIKAAWVQAFIVFFGVLIGMLVNAIVVYKNNFAAGLFAP